MRVCRYWVAGMRLGAHDGDWEHLTVRCVVTSQPGLELSAMPGSASSVQIASLKKENPLP